MTGERVQWETQGPKNLKDKKLGTKKWDWCSGGQPGDHPEQDQKSGGQSRDCPKWDKNLGGLETIHQG